MVPMESWLTLAHRRPFDSASISTAGGSERREVPTVLVPPWGRIYARSLKRSPIRGPGNDGEGVAAHYCLLAPGRKPNISFLLSASPCVGPAHKGT